MKLPLISPPLCLLVVPHVSCARYLLYPPPSLPYNFLSTLFIVAEKFMTGLAYPHELSSVVCVLVDWIFLVHLYQCRRFFPMLFTMVEEGFMANKRW